ncbi:MAG: hypothetical protein ACRDO1_18905 [Nocardioidaceae bacterium]
MDPNADLRKSLASTGAGIGVMAVVVVLGLAGAGLGMYTFGESDQETVVILLVIVALLAWGLLALTIRPIAQTVLLVVAAPATTFVAMSAPWVWGIALYVVLMVALGALFKALRR